MKNKSKIIKFIVVLIMLVNVFLLPVFFLKSTNKQFARNQKVTINSNKNLTTTSSNPKANPQSSNIIDKTIVLPKIIPFVFVPIDRLIPKDPKSFPKEFEKFYKKLLNDPLWIRLKEKNIAFSNALTTLYNWYQLKINAPEYVGNFPNEAKIIVTDKLDDLFRQINGIANNPKKVKVGLNFKYIFPKINNIIDKNYASSPTPFPNLDKFDYKILSIDTKDLQADDNLFFWLQYSYNDGNKYNIYIRNKNNELANQSNNIIKIMQKGCIIIRQDNKNYQSGDEPIKLNNINLSIVKDNNKIEFYVSIKNKNDFAKLIVKNNLPSNWEKNVKIGLLDYPANSKSLQEVINQGKSYNMIPNIPNNHISNDLLAYSEKSVYQTNNKGANQNFFITFYMAPGETINIPVFYKGEQIEGASNLVLITDNEGALKINKKTLKIPSDNYAEGVKPIEIKHRTSSSALGTKWTEVKIITDNNVVVGSKNILKNNDNPQFKLKDYGAIQKNIIFEKPLEFNQPYKTQKISYAKIFDTDKLTKKMIGELYYNAWGINKDKYNFQLLKVVKALNNNIVIPEQPLPLFENNQLNYDKTEDKLFMPTDIPFKNNELVQNNFGKLLQDINNYYNNLNSIIKKITNKNISLLKGFDFLKPSSQMQEYKFVNDILLGKNINDVVRKNLQELEFATEAFINGSDLLPEDVKKIPKITKIVKDNKASWAEFALPRIIKIVLNRYLTVFSKFENALLNYKYEKIIIKLLEANVNKYDTKFIGINLKIISQKNMKIGPKNQNMLILKEGSKTNNFNNFKEQLQTVLNYFKYNLKIPSTILNDENYKSFLKSSSLLLQNKKAINIDKKALYKQIKLLFKILDFYIREKKYSLQKILDIGYFIKNDQKRLKILINNFNDAVSKLLESKKIYVSAYAFKALVQDRLIEIAEINTKKIFDSFLNKSGLNSKEKQIIRSYKNYDYSKSPNKLFEIAIKIGEFNFNKFLVDITGKNIVKTANKILNLDPRLQLPSNLPPESTFTNIIKSISQQAHIIYIILGITTSFLGAMIFTIGIINKRLLGSKLKILIAVGLIVFGVFTLSIVFLFPAIGNLSLLIR